METVQVRCPVCGAFGAPGSFCEMGCGRLPQTVAATPALVSQSRSLPSVSAEWGAPRIVATRPDRFAEGCVEQVAFAYGFAADVFERLEISVRDGADELGALGTDHRPGRSGELRLNVQPRRAGHLVLTVEVACHLDNEAERLVYRGELEVEVTPRLSHVTFSPTITITGNYGNDLAGTRIGNLNLPGVERAGVSPVVNPLLLTLVRMPERLLLTCPERTLQVFARDRIALGRSRGNDVVLRVFDPAEQPRDDVSRRLSGTHVRLIVDRDGVEL